MNDPREYSVRDWYRLFIKAIPGFLMACVVVMGPVIVLAVLAWVLQWF